MSFWNKLIPRQTHKDDNDTYLIQSSQTNQILAKIERSTELTLNNFSSNNGYTRISFTEIALMGATFSSILAPLQTVTQTVQTNGGETLYRCIFPNNTPGKLAVSPSDGMNLGAIIKDGGGLAQARWQPVAPQTNTITTSVPFDPTTLLITAALVGIEQQLVQIQQTQQQILSFLEHDKQAKLESDIKTLTSILTRYKTSWNSESFKSNYHMQVINIKQSALQNIAFYAKEIKEHLNKKQSSINSSLSFLHDKFKYYRLSNYMYAFSSFLEIMLSENYHPAIFSQTINEIEQQETAYKELFANCYRKLQETASSSPTTIVVDGINAVSKSIGKLLHSENIAEHGEQLKDSYRKHAIENVNTFVDHYDSGCVLFIENLHTIDTLFNHSAEICFDAEALYITAQSAK